MTDLPTGLHTYVVNLARRADRRVRMTTELPDELPVSFTSDWHGSFDGRTLTRGMVEDRGYRLFPWRVDSTNPWWSRPLKLGEIGCSLNHLACWHDAAAHGYDPVLILEDDACLVPDFVTRLGDGLAQLRHERDWDLIYLGRVPQEPDQGCWGQFAVPGYSHCTFGYLLTQHAVHTLLTAGFEQALMPVDEFLPALYTDHPRRDVQHRFPKKLTALAFEPPLVTQLPKDVAGSDTEDTAYIDDS